MNELMITFLAGRENYWTYYKTHSSSAEKAYNEFLETLDNNGIDICNMPEIIEVKLYDQNGEVVDLVNFVNGKIVDRANFAKGGETK